MGSFKRYRVSIWDNESVVEIDSGHTTLQMYLMPLNYIL